MRALLLSLCAALLSGCVAVPEKVMAYDAKCDLIYDKLVLTREPLIITSANCNDHCGPLLLVMAAIPPASVLVSGSIVVVGNTVHWAQRQRDCMA